MSGAAKAPLWRGHYTEEEVVRWRRQTQRMKKKLFARHRAERKETTRFSGLVHLREANELCRLVSIGQLESIGLMRDVDRAEKIFQLSTHSAHRMVSQIRAAMDLAPLNNRGPR